MVVRGFLLSAVASRSAPLALSAVLHAGVATGLVMGAGGHGPGASAAEAREVSVELLAPAEPPAEPIAQPKPEEPAANVSAPTHAHAYPVAPSHDARPHDPSLAHDHAEPAASEPPAAAGSVLANEAPAAAAMPVFTIASGSGSPHAAHVAAAAAPNGAGPGAASAPEITLPESAVSVSARLVTGATASYPPGARAGELEADVPLDIVVDTTGGVIDARVLQRAGSGFDESALAAIRRYRFSPAQRDGHAVRVRMRWSVQFRLQ